MKFENVLETQLTAWNREIETMELLPLARDLTGFYMRAQRTISLHHFVAGILAVAALGKLSCERVSAAIAHKAKTEYSKQAFYERLGTRLVDFLLAVFSRCFAPVCREASERNLLTPFARVLIQDSSSLALPKHLADQFPGSSNQRKSFAMLKIQVVCDLLNAKLAHLSLSGFTRNDQAASPDILEILQPKDLVIRDLGYFVLSVLQRIITARAFFLSRYRHGVMVLDPSTRKPIDLLKHLRKYGSFDAPVLLGQSEKVPVRLAAIPVPDPVANSRRRQLRQNRDRRLNPNKKHLALLGWNIFVTNVSPDVWPSQCLPILYRLRWRIEILFKAWKSCLRLGELSCQTAEMLSLSIVTKLIFCAFAVRVAYHMELLDSKGRSVSILRLCRILSALALYYEAILLDLRVSTLLALLMDRHAFYEPRTDRPSFPSILRDVVNGSGRITVT